MCQKPKYFWLGLDTPLGAVVSFVSLLQTPFNMHTQQHPRFFHSSSPFFTRAFSLPSNYTAAQGRAHLREATGVREGGVSTCETKVTAEELPGDGLSIRFLPLHLVLSAIGCLRGKERLVRSHRVLVGAVLCSCVKKAKPVRSSGDCRNIPASCACQRPPKTQRLTATE